MAPKKKQKTAPAAPADMDLLNSVSAMLVCGSDAHACFASLDVDMSENY